MKITPSLFHAHLKCPTKCWLRFTGEPAPGNVYAEWVQRQNESYRVAAIERLQSEVPQEEWAVAPAQENLKTSKCRLGFDVSVTPSDNLETNVHAIERVPPEGRGKSAQFIPIRYVFTNKLGKDEKLLLAFDALVLSEILGREVSLGKIIYGDNHAMLKVKISALTGGVRKRIERIAESLSSPSPPDLVLNRHCGECEFQIRCRQKAIEKDDLSLLAGMSEKERQKFHNKGIFTVRQLSYDSCWSKNRMSCKSSSSARAILVRMRSMVAGRKTANFCKPMSSRRRRLIQSGCRITSSSRNKWVK